MPTYASQTDVTPDRSRAEIERTLQRYGASGFMYGWQGTRAIVGFQMHNRNLRFELVLPDIDSDEFSLTETGRERAPNAALKAWEQACKQRWRALALIIKAKLESVEAGVYEFDEAFLPDIVLHGGQTAGRFMLPKLDDAAAGKLPMLPGPD